MPSISAKTKGILYIGEDIVVDMRDSSPLAFRDSDLSRRW